MEIIFSLWTNLALKLNNEYGGAWLTFPCDVEALFPAE